MLLKVHELVRCCYGITFREFEVELADVNRSLRNKSSDLSLHFAQGPANSTDRHPAYETSQTTQRG